MLTARTRSSSFWEAGRHAAADDTGVHRVLTAYSRVTVITAERMADLALPSALPIADVLPQMMRFLAPDHERGADPTSWTLSRLGGGLLPLSQTLADLGVVDGDVLELRPREQEVRPLVVEDVRDAVEDSVEAAGGVWSRRTTASYAVLTGAVVLAALGLGGLVALLLGSPRWLHDLAGIPAAVLATLALGAATWWSGRYARLLDAQVAGASAMLWGAVLGLGIGASIGADTPVRLLLAVAGQALVAGALQLVSLLVRGHGATGAVLLAAGIADAVASLAGAPHEDAARVLPVLALLAVGVLPRVSLSVGGLMSADYRVRHVGRLDLATLRNRYRTSNALLIGGLVGIALVAVWGADRLNHTGRGWDLALAISIGAAALLRSRLFSRTQHMLPLRISGTVVWLLVLVAQARQHPAFLPWLVVALAVGLAAVLATVSIPMSDITRARVRRMLNAVEFLVIIDLVVLMCGALGVYALMGDVFK